MDKSPWSVRAKPGTGESSDDLAISYQHSFFLRWHKRIYTSVWITLILACLLTAYAKIEELSRWEGVIDSTQKSSVILWLILISIGAALTQSAFGTLAKHQLKSAIIRSRGQRCPGCFYNLSARAHDIDTCPECGVIAPRRECVRLWCKLLRTKL
ncbi:MAG: hypothetical protein P1U42_05165 [Phycisphaerales bacterium]|nr:hypothetical protein [Phycisphaerales bacterium]